MRGMSLNGQKFNRAQICGNIEVRVYHFRIPITERFSWDRLGGSVSGSDAHPTIELLKDVPGISTLLLFGAYEIMVGKGRLFGWDEIESLVLPILEAHDSIGEAKQ